MGIVERTLLDGLLAWRTRGLRWKDLPELVPQRPATSSNLVSWRRAATNLANQGLVDLAYAKTRGTRRVLVVRQTGATYADDHRALGVQAVRTALLDLRRRSHETRLREGAVFAIDNLAEEYAAEANYHEEVYRDGAPQSDTYLNASGPQPRYPRAALITEVASECVWASNFVADETAPPAFSMTAPWLEAFLIAAADPEGNQVLFTVRDQVRSMAEAWFYGELVETERRGLIDSLPSARGLGRRAKPRASTTAFRRAWLPAGATLPLGYHDLGSNRR